MPAVDDGGWTAMPPPPPAAAATRLRSDRSSGHRRGDRVLATIGRGRPYWVRHTARFWSGRSGPRPKPGCHHLVDAGRRVPLRLREGSAHVDRVGRAPGQLGPLGELAGQHHRLAGPEREEDRVLPQPHGIGEAQVVEQLLDRQVAGQRSIASSPVSPEVGDRGGEVAGWHFEALDVDDDVIGVIGGRRGRVVPGLGPRPRRVPVEHAERRQPPAEPHAVPPPGRRRTPTPTERPSSLARFIDPMVGNRRPTVGACRARRVSPTDSAASMIASCSWTWMVCEPVAGLPDS